MGNKFLNLYRQSAAKVFAARIQARAELNLELRFDNGQSIAARR